MNLPTLRFRAIVRARVLESIGVTVDELYPLTLLHAPSGFGKTSVAAQWAQATLDERRVRVVWVYSPEEDLPAEQLWIRMATELSDGRYSSSGSSGSQAREAVDRALKKLNAPTVIVIDDYQHVSSSELDMALARLLERTPLLHLLVISRRFSTLNGPLISSRVLTKTITGEDLAFTDDECHELADSYGVPHSPTVERLSELACGWPMMVRSVLQELSDGSDSREVKRTIERFGHQHLNEITLDNGKRALLATALCPGLSIEMLSQLTDTAIAQTQSLARRLTELGLVSESLAADTNRYYCHPGLREALLNSAQQEFGNDAQAILQRHSADLVRDEPFEAVALLLNEELYDEAARLLTRYFLDIMRAGRNVLERLRQVPDDVMQRHPSLIAASLLLETPEVDTPNERLEHLYQWLRDAVRSRMLEGDFDQNTAVITSLLVAERMRGDMNETLRLARDIEKRTLHLPENRLLHYRFTLPLVFSALGLAGLVCGDLELAARSYRRAAEIAARFAITGEEIRGLNGLASAVAVTRDLPEARRRVQEAETLRVSAQPQRPDLSWINLAHAKAILAYEQYDAESAVEALALTPGLLQRIEQWPLTIVLEAQARCIAEGPAVAQQLLQQRRREAQGGFPATAYMRLVLNAFSIRLLIAVGNYAAAARQIESLPQQHAETAIAQAILGVYTDDVEATLHYAETARRFKLTHAQELEILLVASAALWQLKQSAKALTVFAQAVELSQRYELRLALSSLPFHTLLELATEAGETDFLARIRAIPVTMRATKIEPLSKAELRILSALAEGLSQTAIAKTFFISVNTVKFHLRSVYRKLGVSGREAALTRAREMLLLPANASEL